MTKQQQRARFKGPDDALLAVLRDALDNPRAIFYPLVGKREPKYITKQKGLINQLMGLQYNLSFCKQQVLSCFQMVAEEQEAWFHPPEEKE
eukprot:10439173-Alexandrium_andersonii.AAC.1